MKRSETVYGWLLDKGSFMQRLKMHGVNDARIHVLQEGWQTATSKELLQLNMCDDQLIWGRDVSIMSGNKTWMNARTVMPKETLTGKEEKLKFLKDRSLGSVLFKDKNLKRSEFEINALEENWWERSSIFIFHGKKILLIEKFSPEVWTLTC
jgi:chorismate--pyruvate lyase